MIHGEIGRHEMFTWLSEGVREPYRPRSWRAVEAVSRSRRVKGGADPPPANRHASDPYRDAQRPPIAPRPALVARQIMTHPVATVGPEITVQEVGRLLHEHGYHHLAVVGPAGELTGMISDRDVLGEGAPARPVGEIMARRVLTVAPETSIRDVARVMVTENVGALPVLDSTGELSGIVTRSDVLQCVLNRAPLDLWTR